MLSLLSHLLTFLVDLRLKRTRYQFTEHHLTPLPLKLVFSQFASRDQVIFWLLIIAFSKESRYWIDSWLKSQILLFFSSLLKNGLPMSPLHLFHLLEAFLI